MKRITIALIAFFICGVAHADLVASNGANELRLKPGPCVLNIALAVIPPKMQPQYHEGFATANGTTYTACWTDTRDGYYLVLFSDGAIGVYPVTAFVEPKTI